jgi:hypothetical protein
MTCIVSRAMGSLSMLRSNDPTGIYLNRLALLRPALVGITEADAADAAKDNWDGTRPNMPYRLGACQALLGT